MLHGRAFLVSFPRRPEQEFVTCDTGHAAHEVETALRIGWPVRVRLVTFKGEGALPILTSLDDLMDLLGDKAVAALKRSHLGYIYS